MARLYSHRRSSSQKKAKPVEAMYAAIVSAATLLVLAAVLTFSVYKAGDTTKWVGGFGVLGLVAAVAAFVYNIGQMKKATDLTERIICMSISSVVLIVWLAIYVIGMIN